ncbi:MAG: exonuclease domain-containing protein [Candidatus Campbellbacteria bacterium]|nr:exonuclease domain-containing protein [Candidatus Campbellbacteria bacterium]
MEENQKIGIVALDTETSGVDFDTSQVIQCGAIFCDKDLNELCECSWNVNFLADEFSWDEESEEIHKISREEAETHGVDPNKFIEEMEKNINNNYDAQTELLILAANAYFDNLMLKSLWGRYAKDKRFPFSYRTIDLSSFGMGLFGETGFSKLRERLGIEGDEDMLHNAMYDARLHLSTYRAILEYINKR